jgi:hypothetical protein
MPGDRPWGHLLSPLLSTSLAAVHSRRSITLKYQPKGPVVKPTSKQCWRRNSPTSLMRSPLRFSSEEDRQHFRQGIRTLTLVYVGIMVLVVAITALRGEWGKQEVTTKAAASADDIASRY